MIKLFTFFIAFNLSSLNFVQANEVLHTAKTDVEASVWRIHHTSQEYRIFDATGFFIRPNLFVTNFHFIDNLLEVNDIYLSQPGNPNTLHVKQVVALSALYDLALLETKESHPYYLTLSETKAENNDELFAIGYPKEVFTKIKKIGDIDYEDNQSFGFPINYLEVQGASGSPILNNQRQVVGVLHAGDTKKNKIYAIKLNYLKNLITGNIGQTCKNMIFQNCLEKDIENLKNLAKQGDLMVQRHLRWMYSQGIAGLENPELANYWQ